MVRREDLWCERFSNFALDALLATLHTLVISTLHHTKVV